MTLLRCWPSSPKWRPAAAPSGQPHRCAERAPPSALARRAGPPRRHERTADAVPTPSAKRGRAEPDVAGRRARGGMKNSGDLGPRPSVQKLKLGGMPASCAAQANHSSPQGPINVSAAGCR